MNFNKFINSDYLKENPLCGIDTYKDELNLTTGACTRQIKKLVLTGEENYSLQSINDYGIANFYFYLGTRIQTAICTHLKRQTTIISQTTDEGYLIALPSQSGQNASFYIRISSSTASTVAELKSYLAQQYAAGTPVTVWYVLATPTTETITVPSGLSGTVEGYLNQSGTPTPTNPIYPTANTVEQWFDLNHYIMGTSTDTITTLPADIYVNDTTATVGLKGQMSQTGTPTPDNPIQPSETGERTGNLFDEDYTGISATAIYKPVYVGNENVTLSIDCPLYQSTGVLFILAGNVSSGISTDTNGVWLGHPKTVTPIDGYVTIAFRGYQTTSPVGYHAMLNTGSTALPYEPYGYKLDISSIGENLFDGDYTVAVMSVSGNTATLNTASSGRTAIVKCEPNTTYTAKKYSASNRFIIAESAIMPVNGTAMSIIQNDSSISEYTFTTSNTTQYVGIYCSTSSEQAEPQLMLNLGSIAKPYSPYNHTTTPVYLGEVETTRKIKKYECTGQESWQFYSDSVGTYGAWQFFANNIVNGLASSSAQSNIADYGVTATTRHMNPYGAYLVTNGTGLAFQMAGAKDTFTNVTAWKSYLQQQYANGTPVTVWYVLATEETGIVNEPIRKIGNYADEVSGITIPTIAGANTLSVGTTLQPSEVTVNYKGWHPVQSVHEKSKNLLDYTTVENTSYATATLILDGITISGKYFVQFSSVNFTVGRSYTMSWTENTISGTVRIMWRFRYSDGTYSVMPSSGMSLIVEKEVSALLLYVNGSSTESGVAEITNIMLNEGSTALPYESYWK